MRIFICCVLFFVCLAIIPSANCDKKYNKVTQYDERDRRETKERYSRNNDEDNYKNKKKYRRSDSDEDLSGSKSGKVKRQRRWRDDDEEDVPRSKKNKEKVVRRTIYEDTDEDYTDEDLSDVCANKRRGRCESDDLTDETDEDYTDEDNDDRQTKRRVIYVKKFPHEKKKQRQDKETGSILKIHRKAGAFGKGDVDDITSEEVGIPKRRRYIYEDDDE